MPRSTTPVCANEESEERRGGVNLEGIIQVSLFKVESERADAASVPLDTRDTKASTSTITTTGDIKASTTSSITTMQPQHIYMQTNDQFEVFTTVLSPQGESNKLICNIFFYTNIKKAEKLFNVELGFNLVVM